MSDAGDRFTVVIEPSGRAYEARADVAILQSAREAGLMLPSSCRNGTCRTCICRMLGGSVRYAIEWPGLSAEEKAEGFILPCVAMPASALVLDAPRLIAPGGASDRARHPPDERQAQGDHDQQGRDDSSMSVTMAPMR